MQSQPLPGLSFPGEGSQPPVPLPNMLQEPPALPAAPKHPHGGGWPGGVGGKCTRIYIWAYSLTLVSLNFLTCKMQTKTDTCCTGLLENLESTQRSSQHTAAAQ